VKIKKNKYFFHLLALISESLLVRRFHFLSRSRLYQQYEYL